MKTCVRLPIYGQRDIDAAVRVAIDDPEYGRWLMERIDDAWRLVTELDGEPDPCGMSAHDVDGYVQSRIDHAKELDDDLDENERDEDSYRAEECAQEQQDQKTSWLLFRLPQLLGRSVAPKHLDHQRACTCEIGTLAPPQYGGVYAISGVHGWVKIGRAKNIASRMRDLQVGSPVPLRLLAVLSLDEDDERDLHRRWSHLRTSGEWFRLDAELLGAIAAARSQVPA